MPHKIAIIGAGVSGSLLAQCLQGKHEVTVFDKARGCGGRLSCLKKDNYSFDKGTQDFFIKNKRTFEVIEPAIKAGLLSVWRPSFMMINGAEKKWVKSDKARHYCGHGNVNRLVKEWLNDINTYYSTGIVALEKNHDNWFLISKENERFGPFDAVIMSQPAEQALMLAPHFKSTLENLDYSSCMMLYLGVSQPIPSSVAEVTMSEGTLTRWIIQNHRKPGMASLDSLILQSKSLPYETMALSSNALAKQMIEESEAMLGCKLAIEFKAQHQWRYAKCLNATDEGSLWEPSLGLGVIGDGLGSSMSDGVESAILSAMDLSNKIQRQGINRL
mgnify:CR=1 FL=1